MSAPANAGRLYSRTKVRRLYTPLVIHASHPWAWGVSNPGDLDPLYDAVTQRHTLLPDSLHVEVGPGNAEFWRRAAGRGRVLPPRIDLLDCYPNPLSASRERLLDLGAAETGLDTYACDALQSWPQDDGTAATVAASMMVHTLPGATIAAKEMLFAEAARVLAPGGLFVGATILGDPDPPATLGRVLARRYRRAGYFDNARDSATDLRAVLMRHFAPGTVRVRTRPDSAVALWSAERHREATR